MQYPASVSADQFDFTSFLPPSGDFVDCEALTMLRSTLQSCGTLAASVNDSLANGDRTASAAVFRQAEEAFEEAQSYLDQIAREDSRVEMKGILDDLGLRLDKLWLRLITAK